MTLDKLRRHCLAFPGATEQIQWGSDLVFKVGGKMFVVAATEPVTHVMSFKCSDEGYAELLECDGVTPAPYLARAKWVALERYDALRDREIQDRIAAAYQIVFGKLTGKEQARINAARERSPRTPLRKTAARGRSRVWRSS
jgi:predicted DNA-binding protein (MmcQ/YjbR family)